MLKGPPPATLPLALDEALLQVESSRAKRVLFWGERVAGVSSYLAGWMAGEGIDVIVLDGANGFDPYTVSSFARKALIPPEKLLKRIRIARAFTCYQMATLTERLELLLCQEGTIQTGRLSSPVRKPYIVLLGPVTPFLDEDVPEREARPLFERTLRKMEALAEEKVPFFLFQSSWGSHRNPSYPSLAKGRRSGIMSSRGDCFMKKLFQFSSLTWKVSLEDEGPNLVLEKRIQGRRGDLLLSSGVNGSLGVWVIEK
ncbi:MAG: hypothetical protein EHM36_02800 [Deltaproteobacteria bacterium]|nr:MAG: hypothetical protein EHM36_02800 [Deltaproteobacteria bacterium]